VECLGRRNDEFTFVGFCCIVGEILPVHVTVQPGDKEKGIVEMLKKMVSMKDKLEELSSAERSCANDLLKQLQAVLVGACITDSITMFVHLLTSEILGTVHEMFDSGQLTVVVRDLFRCLAKDESLTIEVEIVDDLFKECEDGFTDDGMHRCTMCVKLSLLCDGFGIEENLDSGYF